MRPAATAVGTVDFAARRPADLRRQVPASCHGASKRRGGLRLDRKADALAGGDSGRVVEPGKGAESLLIEYVVGRRPTRSCPPRARGNALTPEQVGLLRAWIDQGAPWPDDGAPAAAGSDHWAFRPVARPDGAAALKDRSWVRNPIDAFILARLEAERVEPSPEADRPTLIRRLSLDLLGLPPAPAEVEAFVNDASPDAYERLVDRLLASPHLRRAVGPALARPGPLRRQRRLREGLAPPQRLALPRLGHRRPQPRPPVRPVHRRATGRRPAPRRRPPSQGRDRLPPQHADQPRGGRRPGGVPRRGGRRPRQHDRHRLARPDGRLRPVPHAQV